MLYLEDYLEMIEHLPQELRDRFTEMREMDLSVQNNMDTLDKRVRVLFGSCRRGEITNEQAHIEFADIRKGYNRTFEDADEKVQLANQMYELVERYLRRLDTELHKFKCELEADNKGITELLEKRSLELDTPASLGQSSQNNHYKENRYRVRAERRRESWGSAAGSGGGRAASDNRALLAAPAPPALSRADSAIQAALGRESSVSSAVSAGNYGLGNVGAGTAIAAAASQAIAATQQMQQGRRTASLKASYEAVELGLARELAGAAHTALQAANHDTHSHNLNHTSSHGHHSSSQIHQSSSSHGHHSSSSSNSNKRHKKKNTNYSISSNVSTGHPQALSAAASRSSSPTLSVMGSVTENTGLSAGAVLEEALTDGEWAADPNEPRYCICNQVSYGDMVACDNQDCPFEWFHYPCVGITAPPKGKWYCPQCSSNMRRSRANRKN